MAEMRRLEKKVAIITGGGTGIGEAIAKRFVEEGARVCIAGRRKEPLEKVAKSLPPGAVVICQSDVSKQADIDRIVSTALGLSGAIDIVVNNAAVPIHGGVAELTPAEWQQAVDVNLTGPFLLMNKIIPIMIKAGGGAIVNIASLAGLRCVPHSASYCSTKAGLIMLTQQAAIDYGPMGVRCNVVCPGLTRTDMNAIHMDRVAKARNIDREGAYKLAAADLAVRRPAYPNEIAPLCAFLASDEAAFITGDAIAIDGGIHMLDAGMVALKE